MWTASTRIATTASPQALWRLFEDVAGWTAWNAGIERVALHGPFASGSAAATLGPLLTPDFPEMLAALKALAERDGPRQS